MASLQDGDPHHVAAYLLVRRLAVGGMGIVYLGESPSGRPVAVKLIRPEWAADPEFRARFRREVEAAQLVSGFHTAAFVAADPDADPPWLVTQYVPGPSLADLVTLDGPLDPAAALRLGAALAEGLDAIHSAGLVHRDLKPANIIMAADGPRIIDFGIAKATGASSDPRLTATGMVVGTPAFLSPEQLDGDGPVGPPSDIFSLGSVLAFAASGRAPFECRQFAATSYAIVNKPPDLRLLATPVRDIVAACLAKDPASRPTAVGLLGDLRSTRTPVLAAPPPHAAEDTGGVGGAGRAGGADGVGGVGGVGGAAEAAGAIVRAVPNRSVAPDPAAALQVKPAPVSPAPVRAGVGRRALARGPAAPRATVPRATVPRVMVPRTVTPAAGKLAPLPQPVPSPVQVRPARQGWRLVTADVAGRWVATANGDGIITVWLAGSGLPLRSWSAGTQLRAMAAGPDDLLIVATGDGRIDAWDAVTGTARRYLPGTVPGLTGREARLRCVALDPSGSWLAAGVDGRLLLWDVADPGEPVPAAWLPCPAEVTALAFDDTGWRLATGDEAGKVHVWDLAELAAAAPVNPAAEAAAFDAVPLEPAWVDPPGTLPGASRPHSGRVLALAWDDAHDRWRCVGTNGRPDTAVAASAATGSAATEGIGIAGVPLAAAALSPDGGFAAMIDDARGRVYLADLGDTADLDDTARPRALDGADLIVTGVAFTGSGMLAVGGSDGSLRLWHPSRHTIGVVREAGSAVTAIAAAPDGARLVVSDRRAELSSFEAVNGSLKPGWAVDSGSAGQCLAFGADGTRLVTAGDSVRIWDAADGAPTGILPGRTGRARAVAADHDGSRIAAAWAETVVTVWEGNRLLWELTGHKGAVRTVAFGPRPGLLVSAGDDETIRTWDLATGRQTGCHSPPGCRVLVLAADRSSGTLAAGCADGTVRLYPAGQQGRPADWADAPVLVGHVHGITALSFDLGGRYLATAGRDGTARIWDLATRSATTVLLPGAAAVVSTDGTWRGLGQTDGLIWQAVGLTRVPLPTLEAVT